MKANDGSPTSIEIGDQLGRMLAMKRFRNAPNQAALLELVVLRALEGKKTPGRVIAKALFGGKFNQGESTDVRVTAANLRSTLRKYYAAEGSGDLVAIALPEPSKDRTVRVPEGEAYTPEFSYNPVHAVTKEVKLGQYFSARGMFRDYTRSILHFKSALQHAPQHIGAAIGIAEAYCGALRWKREYMNSAAKEEWISRAAGWLDRVYDRAAEFWHLHAAAGFLYMSNEDLSRAEQSFVRAITLDRVATENYNPYFEFLLRSGNKAEGVRLARKYLDAHPDNVAAYTMHARILLLAGETDSATEATEAAVALDLGNYEPHVLLSRLRAMQRRPREVLSHLNYLRLVSGDDVVFKITELDVSKMVATWPAQYKNEFRTELRARKLLSHRLLASACRH